MSITTTLHKMFLDGPHDIKQCFHGLSQLEKSDENVNLVSKFLCTETNKAFKMVLTNDTIKNISNRHSKIEEWIEEAFMNEQNENYSFLLKDSSIVWKRQKSSASAKLMIVEIEIELIDVSATHKEMFNFAIEKLKKQKEDIAHLENKKSNLTKKNEDNETKIEKMTKIKEAQEKDLYGSFLPILNEKKEQIQRLKEELEEEKEQIRKLKGESEKSKEEIRKLKAESSQSKRIHNLSSDEDNDNNGIEMIELDADSNEETSNQGFDDSQNFLTM